MTTSTPQPTNCALCGRPLRTAASRARGIGPHCLRKLPHAPSPTPAPGAQALTAATTTHPEQAAELAEWAQRVHQRCRRNHKFTGRLCDCTCH